MDLEINLYIVVMNYMFVQQNMCILPIYYAMRV
jgi:hypothetical protein